MSDSDPRRPKPGDREQVSGARKHTRKYTNRTVSLLFGLSGNRCAHPDCIHKIIESHTEFDDAAIIGHIAHIYSGSEIGPRSYAVANFDPKLLNNFENLILLCRHHHGIVDGQSSTYTAEQIRIWKEDHLAKNLFRRVSLLHEKSADHSIYGFTVHAFTVDAKFIQVGIPDTKIITVGHGSQQSQVVHTITPYIFELNNGHQYTIILKNIQFACAISNRVAILCIRTEDGAEYPFSIYDYHSSEWTVLPEPEKIELVGRGEARIGSLIFCLLLILFLVCLWSENTIYQIMAGGVVFCAACLVSSMGFMRKVQLRSTIRRLQSLVKFR